MSETTRNGFPLTDVVNQLRKEISSLSKQIKDRDIRFDVNEIEVELQTIVEEVKGADGGFNFSVLKFGGKFDEKNAAIQRVKLKLKPVKAPDGSADAGEGDQNVQISANQGVVRSS